MAHSLLITCADWWRTVIPIAILSGLAQNIVAGGRGTRMHTYRIEVHEAGEGNGPDALGVDYIVTMELGKDQR